MNEHVALKPRDVGYDADFFEWTQHQAELLRAGRLDLVDVENIAEEIESLGKSDRRAIESQLVRLIAHLLKLQFSSDVPPRGGWKESVLDARLEIELALDDSPSLRRLMPDLYAKQWKRGYHTALAGLSKLDRTQVESAPNSPTLALAQALDPEFFPGD